MTSLSSEPDQPLISIITPSFNQGQFIEETIRSVTEQSYSNIEYIIIDGGSTDNTVEVIKKYESRISYWISEPDRGQTHAINKGLAIATGSIVAYINSDDFYLPGALQSVAKYFVENPETDLLHGRCRYVDEQGHKIGDQFGNIQSTSEMLDIWDIWWKGRQFVQPEVFWSRRISDKIGGFCERLNYVMDYDYWLRIFHAQGCVRSLDRELTSFRFTQEQKSNQKEDVAVELLELIKPWLWSNKLVLPTRTKIRLQAQWLYQVEFLAKVQNSLNNNDAKLMRWIRLGLAVFSHPKMLVSPQFIRRIEASLLKGKKRSFASE